LAPDFDRLQFLVAVQSRSDCGRHAPFNVRKSKCCRSYLATYQTTHDLLFATSLLAVTIPAVEGSLTLAGNIFRRTHKMKLGPAHRGS
jgi:hypothetical protein